MVSGIRVAILAAACALTALPAAAAEPTSDFPRFFASGVRLYRSMDFESALEQFKLARQQPHGADDDVRASLYQAILLFELGKETESTETFRSALSVDPQAKLPVSVAPRIEAAFLAERAQIAKLVAATPPPSPATPPAAVAAPAQAFKAVEPPAKTTSSAKVAGGVLAGVGALALAGGLLSYGLAWSQYQSYTQGLLTRSEAATVNVEAPVGLGLAIAGGAMAVTGIVLLALPNGTRASAGLAPTPGGVSVCLQGTLP